MAARAQDTLATRDRRQKIFVIAGGVVLLGLVGYQVPKLLSSGSKSSSPPPPAVPLARPAVPVATPAEVAAKNAAARLSEHDLFLPLVHLPQSPSTNTQMTPRAPAVRAKAFVAKDMFIPQVVIPTAPVAPTSGSVAVPFPDQTKVLPTKDTGGNFIVILQVIDGTNRASLKAAARAVVAAKNAGLKDVVANDTLGPRTGPKAHFTIFTGLYTTQSGLAAELQRAHRNGYPGAYSERVDNTPIGGF